MFRYCTHTCLTFQIRHHCCKYGEGCVGLDTPYTVLTMDTLQTKCGDTKVDRNDLTVQCQ